MSRPPEHERLQAEIMRLRGINADLLAIVRGTQDYLDKRWDDANALDDAICAAIARAEGESNGLDAYNHQSLQLHRARALNADLLAALKEAQFALLSSILFIEGVFPEPRSRIMANELVSYRMRELKARVAIAGADGEA